jgi:glutaryl-CoA dehydrogenase
MQDLFSDLLYIDNSFTEEEILIRSTVREFADKNIIPVITEHYEQGTFPPNLKIQLASLGLLGMTLPEQYGGSNASSVAYGLACQELERGDSAVRSYVSVQSSLCMYPIYAYGTEEQKKKYLPAMSRAEVIGCFGLTEPDSGSDPASMKTVAVKKDNHWILNGSKMWITNATVADIGIIWAKTEQGIRGFIVDLKADGVTRSEIKLKMSLRASITGELAFSNVVVPAENLLPGTEKGLVSALGCLTQARYGIAWGAMGAAMFCFEKALEYAKQRIQFNSPIAGSQLVQKQLVDAYTEICKAQLLNLNLGKLKDNNQAHYAYVSMAKMNACREAINIARVCRNILGANGISLEYHVIRHMNNLESVFTYEGTDNVHTLIVGRHLTGISAFSS